MRRGGDCSWRMRRRCDVADAAATAGGNFMNFRKGVPCLKHFMCRPQVPTSAHDFPRFYTRCVQVVRSVAALVGLQLLGMNGARDCAGEKRCLFQLLQRKRPTTPSGPMQHLPCKSRVTPATTFEPSHSEQTPPGDCRSTRLHAGRTCCVSAVPHVLRGDERVFHFSGADADVTLCDRRAMKRGRSGCEFVVVTCSRMRA